MGQGDDRSHPERAARMLRDHLREREQQGRARRMGRDERDRIPDVRDGLTRIERVVLWQLHEAQKERGDRNVPTAMLYGRVVEHVNISVEELQRVLARLTGKGL